MDTPKPMVPDEVHLRILKKLVNLIVRLHSTIFKSSWQLGKVPDDWNKAKATSILDSGTYKNQSNCQPRFSPWESCTIGFPMYD